MGWWSVLRAGVALALWRGAVEAHACTVCDSAVAHQVRAGLFNGHFFVVLAAVLAPFPVLGAAVLGLRCAVPRLLERDL